MFRRISYNDLRCLQKAMKAKPDVQWNDSIEKLYNDARRLFNWANEIGLIIYKVTVTGYNKELRRSKRGTCRN